MNCGQRNETVDYEEAVRTYAWAMLKQDCNFSRVAEALNRQMLGLALHLGDELARKVRREVGAISALNCCSLLNIAVKQAELTLPGRLVRAVYTNEPLEIKVNRSCLPVLANQLEELLSQADRFDGESSLPGVLEHQEIPSLEALALEIILAHELFHYYERKDPSWNPQLTPQLTRGRWFKRRIRVQSLSEIAAHRFAQVFLRLPFYPGQVDINKQTNEVLADYRYVK